MKKLLILLALIPSIALAGASRDLEAGDSDYFIKTDTTSLSITGDLTIAFWAKPESQPGSGLAYILVSKLLSAGNQRSYSFYQENDGANQTLNLLIYGDGATGGNASVTTTHSSAVWHHFVVSWVAASGEATFYVDGASLGSATTGAETAIFDSTASFIVGQNANLPAGFYFDGLMADLGIWARALRASDVAELYAGTPPSKLQTANLKGSWPLFGSISPETDLSGNGNTLTLTNSPAESFDGHPFSQPH